MELRVLKYFLTVAREENITRAAGLLHLTQPTLSRQLMQLEEELGVKLFTRGRHNIVLTDDGMLLKRRAQEIVDLAEKTRREFLHKAEELTGEISIGSGEYHHTKFMGDMLAAFHRTYPRVRFEVYSGNSDNIKERIENGLLDIGILLEPVDISKYEFLRIPEKEVWHALCRVDSELAEKESVTPADLASLPLIIGRRDLIIKELERWFGSYADRLSIVASGNLQYNMATFVRNGMGVALGVKLDLRYDGLVSIPLSPAITSDTMLVWKKAQPFSAAASAFIEHARKYISSMTADSI